MCKVTPVVIHKTLEELPKQLGIQFTDAGAG